MFSRSNCNGAGARVARYHIAPDLDSTKIESIQTQVAGHEREKF